MSPAATVARLFALTGIAGPAPRLLVSKVFLRCPRERLVRAVAWYAIERGRGRDGEHALLEGVRAITRGWSDWYEVHVGEPGRRPIVSPSPERVGDALVIRSPRYGAGWVKPAIAYPGPAREMMDTAVSWLGHTAGCILHDDCVEHPELGAACFQHQQPP